MTGRLIGVARRAARRAPMEECASVAISTEAGLDGDHKGARFPRRQVTVLACEAWHHALGDLDGWDGTPPLPWTVRRANLLVEAVDLPRARGGVVEIGPVLLEVTGQTVPCGRMDEAFKGLLKALYREWRGGVTCRVICGGVVRLGDAVEVPFSPPEHRVRLPG